MQHNNHHQHKKMFRNNSDMAEMDRHLEMRSRFYSYDHTSYRRDHSRVDKVGAAVAVH